MTSHQRFASVLDAAKQPQHVRSSHVTQLGSALLHSYENPTGCMRLQIPRRLETCHVDDGPIHEKLLEKKLAHFSLVPPPPPSSQQHDPLETAVFLRAHFLVVSFPVHFYNHKLIFSFRKNDVSFPRSRYSLLFSKFEETEYAREFRGWGAGGGGACLSRMTVIHNCGCSDRSCGLYLLGKLQNFRIYTYNCDAQLPRGNIAVPANRSFLMDKHVH